MRWPPASQPQRTRRDDFLGISMSILKAQHIIIVPHRHFEFFTRVELASPDFRQDPSRDKLPLVKMQNQESYKNITQRFTEAHQNTANLERSTVFLYQSTILDKTTICNHYDFRFKKNSPCLAVRILHPYTRPFTSL